MAKKKGTFEFSQIGKLMDEVSKKIPIVVEKENTEREYISTGVKILDAALTGSILNGGIQNNRITIFAGDSGVGKSYVCYNIAREAQKKGYKVIYIDTEFSIERQDFVKFGVDNSLDNLILLRTNVVEDINMTLTQMLDKLKEEKKAGNDIEKIIIFLDSLGQLASNKEKQDLVDGKLKQDMTKAKAIGSMFRSVTSDVSYLGIPFVITAQTYQTQDLFPQTVIKGGKGSYYSASTIIELSKSKYKSGNEDDMDIQSGINITAKAIKNRLAVPKKVKFTLDWNTGANKYVGLEGFFRPELFDRIGIAKGKWEEYKKPEVDTETGEEIYGEFKPGGTRYYVRHLGKSVWEKELWNSDVITDDIEKIMEPIINDYFSYKSITQMEEAEKKFFEESEKNKKNSTEFDSDALDAEQLFE